MIILSKVEFAALVLRGKKIFTANYLGINKMKRLVEKRNITEPMSVDRDLKIATEESVDSLIWTAAMPKGELAKLKKVCKPVAAKDGLIFWVVDDSKVTFIQNNT